MSYQKKEEGEKQEEEEEEVEEEDMCAAASCIHFGRGILSWENAPTIMACGQTCGTIFEMMNAVGKSSWLWAVPVLDWLSWAL